MKLVPAEGDLLRQILDDTHLIWADGLTRPAYEKYNLAQLRTAWGQGHLQRFALVDAHGAVVSSAKRYLFTVRLHGRVMTAVGIAAVFTPWLFRRQGHAAHLVETLIADAQREGAELAILFSEIGTSYYERLGFTPVPRHQLLLSVVEKPGAPMVLVRAAEERDIPSVAALAGAMTGDYPFALVPTEDTIRFSLTKKRLLAGLSTPGDLIVEFFIVEEGAGAVAFAILTTAGDDVVLEMCGDRDPAGARVGALFQVLRARTPSERALKMRGALPPGWLPPQLRVVAKAESPDVLMLKPLGDGVLTRPLAEDDVLFWHGDLF